MKFLINYVIQEREMPRFKSEIVDFKLVPPLYSPEPQKSTVDAAIVKWAEMRQTELDEYEKVVILNALMV